MKRAAACAVVSVLLIAAANACNNDGADSPDTDMGSGTQRSACSTGPAYVDAGQFDSSTTPTTTLPDCVPRCDTTAGTLAAVPSGACTVAGEACSTFVALSCPTGERGIRDVLQCQCVTGQWQCVVTEQQSACDAVDASTTD